MMKKAIAVSLLAVWSITGLWSQPLAEWKLYESEAAGFAVRSPAPLRHRVDSTYTPLGAMAYHTYFYRVPDALRTRGGNWVYMISYCDYPPDILTMQEPDWLETFFEETIGAAARSTGGEVIYKTETEVAGYPGYLWRILGPGGTFTVKTKAFLAVRRYYAIQIVGETRRSVHAGSETFMDSFELRW